MTPGSPNAVRAGCSCPVAANNEGMKPPIKSTHWWVEKDCMVHKSWWPDEQRAGE